MATFWERLGAVFARAAYVPRYYVLRAWTNDPTAAQGMRIAVMAEIPIKPQTSEYARGYNDGVYLALSLVQPGIDRLEECVQMAQGALGTGRPITIGHKVSVEEPGA